MSWKSYLFPQTILITTSPYNRHIRVNEECGRMKLLVNGSPQSGTYIEKLWTRAFDHFSMQKHEVQRVLVLGVGGGTVISLLEKIFPGSRKTCIEIDPMMIDIAKKYFSLNSIPRVTIVCEDAQHFVADQVKKKKTYDCIVIDLFSGRHIPPFVKQTAFLQQVRRILSKNGCVYINYLREMEYATRSDKLYRRLQTIYPIVFDYRIFRNRFFYCPNTRPRQKRGRYGVSLRG